MVKADASPKRCPWSLRDDFYIAYHDEEWGVPVFDSQALFERLILEGMQAGLSWITILRKREHMAGVFHRFDPEALAQVEHDEIEAWLLDPGIIRHRGKLQAMIGNARAFLEVPDPVAYLWSFVDGVPQRNRWSALSEVPSQTDTSRTMAASLKAKQFKFVGPTICYAFMQSAGLVNDHLVSCFRHEAV